MTTPPLAGTANSGTTIKLYDNKTTPDFLGKESDPDSDANLLADRTIRHHTLGWPR